MWMMSDIGDQIEAGGETRKQCDTRQGGTIKQKDKKRKVDGTWEKGTGGPGRPKGSKDKVSSDVKQWFLDTFEAIGGVDEMASHFKVAKNKTQFYTLLAKLLPKTIEATLDVNHDIAGQFERDERADKRAKESR